MSFALAHQSKTNKAVDSKTSTLAEPSSSSYSSHRGINNLEAKDSPDTIINHLQRTMGSQAVPSLICCNAARFDFAKIEIQPKLKVSAPGDEYEQEADRNSEHLMRLSPISVFSHTTGAVDQGEKAQRKCGDCGLNKEEDEEVKIAKKESGITGNLEISENIAKHVNDVLYSGGSPIDPSTRMFMESSLGHDFSQVKIHADKRAARSAAEVNSLAYTLGNNIVFGEGQYAPWTLEGRILLGHELVHVIQQRGTSIIPINITRDSARYSEEDAKDTASRRLDAPLNSATRPVLQRQSASPDSTPAQPTSGLDKEMLRQIAHTLREAMSGWGTDEEAIYAALGGRTKEQVDAITRVYNEMYHRDLMADLTDELTYSELLQLGTFNPSKPPAEASAGGQRAEAVASLLHQAMRGLGTDEEAIFSALTGRTSVELQAIKAAYHTRTGQELEADLREELSGSDLTRALMLLNQGVLQPEDELYLAMTGLGTDESTIYRVLAALAGNNTAITNMEAAYRRKYGDLIADLRSDLSSGEYARALSVLRPALQDIAFEDCATTIIPQVRALIPIGIQKTENAINALSLGWAGMTPSQQSTFKQFFDPSNSGFDEQFVADVLQNFRKIRNEFDADLVAECEIDSGICIPGRLYYTYWSNIHICSANFNTETDTIRKARDFVHELAHNALLATDRPYYRGPSDPNYARLTPRGPWTTEIPVIGHLARFISRSDTLYHPDAYSWFAFQV